MDDEHRMDVRLRWLVIGGVFLAIVLCAVIFVFVGRLAE
jgi:hypothetical protein